MKKSFTLEYGVRPWTLNNERKLHHMQRAKLVKEWRGAFCDLAQEFMLPYMTSVEVIAQPYVLNGRYRQDVGGCFPAAKAAIDGLVDAGVLIDDNANVVKRLTFLAPLMGRDAMAITILEVK